MFHCVSTFVVGVLLMVPAWVHALEPSPWPSTVKDMASTVGKAGKAPMTPRVIPATAVQKRPRPIPAVSVASTGESARESQPLARERRPFSGLAPVRSAAPRATSRHLVARAAAHGPAAPISETRPTVVGPNVQAKALCCVDCSSNKVILAKNSAEPLPIASITKLLTAMVVVDGMKLDQVVTVPDDIVEVPPHKVGLRPGERFSVKDVLCGLLMESGNDCAEVLARAYPKGGRRGFVDAMNRLSTKLGASSTTIYTPSGLDMKVTLGRREGRALEATKPNVASARDVALIAAAAFKYPLIREISSTKKHTITTRNENPHTYHLSSTIKLLYADLPVAGAKTGFTNMAGKCIVALFKSPTKEHMVVVLNSRKHFKAAERIYRWANKTL